MGEIPLDLAPPPPRPPHSPVFPVYNLTRSPISERLEQATLEHAKDKVSHRAVTQTILIAITIYDRRIAKRTQNNVPKTVAEGLVSGMFKFIFPILCLILFCGPSKHKVFSKISSPQLSHLSVRTTQQWRPKKFNLDGVFEHPTASLCVETFRRQTSRKKEIDGDAFYRQKNFPWIEIKQESKLQSRKREVHQKTLPKNLSSGTATYKKTHSF